MTRTDIACDGSLELRDERALRDQIGAKCLGYSRGIFIRDVLATVRKERLRQRTALTLAAISRSSSTSSQRSFDSLEYSKSGATGVPSSTARSGHDASSGRM